MGIIIYNNRRLSLLLLYYYIIFLLLSYYYIISLLLLLYYYIISLLLLYYYTISLLLLLYYYTTSLLSAIISYPSWRSNKNRRGTRSRHVDGIKEIRNERETRKELEQRNRFETLRCWHDDVINLIYTRACFKRTYKNGAVIRGAPRLSWRERGALRTGSDAGGNTWIHARVHVRALAVKHAPEHILHSRIASCNQTALLSYEILENLRAHATLPLRVQSIPSAFYPSGIQCRTAAYIEHSEVVSYVTSFFFFFIYLSIYSPHTVDVSSLVRINPNVFFFFICYF